MKRTIKLNGIDKELNLVKVATVNLEQSEKEFIYLDKIDDNNWRMVYTEKTIPEIKDLKSMEIIRDE